MPSDTDKLQAFLREKQTIEYVRLHWIDFSGVLRARFLPVARCHKIAQGTEEYLLPQVSMIIPISTAPRCFPTGDDIETWVLRPDWSSLRACGFKPNHASVMCFMEHKEARDPFSKCPRSLLTRSIQRLEEERGTKILAGFEIEFMLLNKALQPLDQLDRLNSYQTTMGLRSPILEIIEEVIHSFKHSSIGIEHFHTETRDQIEFALSPESLLDAVDSLVLAQETIRTIFVRHDIKATMTPQPLLEGPTSGTHLHMSVDELTAPDTDHFIAGVLSHMRPLCAVGMSNYDSYVRTVTDAAGTWVGYGTENRDLPIRRIHDQHWEVRTMDSTSNPYLFSAAVVLAGLEGLNTKVGSAWLDCRVFPHSLDDDDARAKYGIRERMPHSLEEALEALQKHAELGDSWIPGDLLAVYIPLKRKEVEEFRGMTEEERRLRFLEYF